MRKKCTLQNALDYKNDDVVFRFIKIFNVTEQESILLFEETKKWLWLCYKAAEPEVKFSLLIDDTMLMIDEMWHNFILFTKDYENYCFDKFGFYIHHQPNRKNESENWKKNIDYNVESYLKNIENQYSIIFDFLGEETLILWYKDFAVNYTKEKIKELIR